MFIPCSCTYPWFTYPRAYLKDVSKDVAIWIPCSWAYPYSYRIHMDTVSRGCSHGSRIHGSRVSMDSGLLLSLNAPSTILVVTWQIWSPSNISPALVHAPSTTWYSVRRVVWWSLVHRSLSTPGTSHWLSIHHGSVAILAHHNPARQISRVPAVTVLYQLLYYSCQFYTY